ncbi:type II toxin-antitoxin system RelE/ParE family toxin [Kribbia dieselivorans]|uniref:type II toxin-antitoxin system RelE/ParE family toxin n=1 Tax=Kribbia dieselivorans TaxID=331526 RepID=UPI0009F86F4B
MRQVRLTQSAQADIVDILAWSHEHFGAGAGLRYEALIAAALRDVADSAGGLGGTPRPELGKDVYSWHLRRSRDRSLAGPVHRPRHFLVYRLDQDLVVIGRVLHDAMELHRHLESGSSWAVADQAEQR